MEKLISSHLVLYRLRPALLLMHATVVNTMRQPATKIIKYIDLFFWHQPDCLLSCSLYLMLFCTVRSLVLFLLPLRCSSCSTEVCRQYLFLYLYLVPLNWINTIFFFFFLFCMQSNFYVIVIVLYDLPTGHENWTDWDGSSLILPLLVRSYPFGTRYLTYSGTPIDLRTAGTYVHSIELVSYVPSKY